MQARVQTTTLDGIRGVLAIIVCLAHSWQILVNPQYGPYHWDHAILGLSARYAVDAFYVLSGWVICQSVYINLEKGQGFQTSDWALNRLFRIGVPLMASIFIAMLVWAIVRATHLDQTDTPFGLARIKYTYRIHEVLLGLLTLGFLGDITGGMNGPLWSLSIEIQLYAIVCACYWSKGRSAAFCILILLISMYRTTLDPNTLLGYGAFFLGFAASWLSLFRPSWFTRPLKWKYVGLLIFVSAILYMLNSYRVDNKYLDTLAEIDSVRIQLIFAIGFALFLLGEPNINSSWIGKSGKFSYTLYIIHFPLLLLLSYFLYKYTNVMSHVVMAWSLWLGCALLMIYIAYRLGSVLEKSRMQRQWALDKYAHYMSERKMRAAK